MYRERKEQEAKGIVAQPQAKSVEKSQVKETDNQTQKKGEPIETELPTFEAEKKQVEPQKEDEGTL